MSPVPPGHLSHVTTALTEPQSDQPTLAPRLTQWQAPTRRLRIACGLCQPTELGRRRENKDLRSQALPSTRKGISRSLNCSPTLKADSYAEVSTKATRQKAPWPQSCPEAPPLSLQEALRTELWGTFQLAIWPCLIPTRAVQRKYSAWQGGLGLGPSHGVRGEQGGLGQGLGPGGMLRLGATDLRTSRGPRQGDINIVFNHKSDLSSFVPPWAGAGRSVPWAGQPTQHSTEGHEVPCSTLGGDNSAHHQATSITG